MRSPSSAPRSSYGSFCEGHRVGGGGGDDIDTRGSACPRAGARGRGVGVSLDLRLALQAQRADALREPVGRLLAPFSGNDDARGAGCGTGSLRFALAGFVAEVVGADTSAEYLEAARAAAPENVR